MQVSAVTVSVHYADHLRHVLANRRHFDRWVVVTVPDDDDTMALCRSERIECIVSKRIERLGAGFNPALNKAPLINEGLEAVDCGEGWAALLDADILLPSSFRERLEALPLQRGALYGLAGLRVARSLAAFETLRRLEPWILSPSRRRHVLGSFSLFSLEAEPRRCPEGSIEGQRSFDDSLFSEAFGEQKCRLLPLPCLHLGGLWRNWFGRVTPSVAPSDSAAEGAIREAAGDWAREAAGLAPSAGGLLALGIDASEAFGRLAPCFSEALVVDTSGSRIPSSDPLVAAARRCLADEIDRLIARAPNARLAGPAASSTLASLGSRKFDALMIGGEPAPETLIDLLPRFLYMLRDGGVLCGGGFDTAALPGAAAAIASAFGLPDRVHQGGWWTKRLAAPTPRASSSLHDPAERAGALVFADSPGDAERLAVTLLALRRHWSGPLAVIFPGGAPMPMRSLLSAFSAAAVAAPGGPSGAPREIRMIEALRWSPFDRALMLDSSVLTDGPLGEWFRLLDSHDMVLPDELRQVLRMLPPSCRAASESAARSSESTLSPERRWPLLDTFACRRDSSWINEWLHRAALLAEGPDAEAGAAAALRALASAGSGRSLGFIGRGEAGLAPQRVPQNPRAGLAGEDGWASPPAPWQSAELEALSLFAADVSMPADTALVIPVGSDDLEIFRRFRRAVRFHPRPRTILFLLDGLGAEDLSMEDAESDGLLIPDEIRTAERPPQISDDEPAWTEVLLDAPSHIREPAWILLDPAVFPQPGAALFADPLLRRAPLVASADGFARITADLIDERARAAGALNVPASALALWQEKHVLKFPQAAPPAALLDTAVSRQAAEAYLRLGIRMRYDLFLSVFAAAAAGKPPVTAYFWSQGWSS